MDNERGMHADEDYYLLDREILDRLGRANFKKCTKTVLSDAVGAESPFRGLETRMNEENVVSPVRPLPAGLWIVIAAYNEQRRIGAVLDDLLKVVKNVVVVDDGSRDDTAGEVLKRPVWLVRHAVNLGQGAALQTGIAFALERQAEYIITFDADGQHCTSDLPAADRASHRGGRRFRPRFAVPGQGPGHSLEP